MGAFFNARTLTLCPLRSDGQAAEGEPNQPAGTATGPDKNEKVVAEESEEESCDYGCAPPKAATRVPAAEDSGSESPTSAEKSAIAALAPAESAPAAAVPDAEDQGATAEDVGQAQAATADADEVDDSPDEATAEKGGGGEGVAAAGAADENEGPTDESLVEAVRGIPGEVEDIGKLTPKQVTNNINHSLFDLVDDLTAERQAGSPHS